MGYEDLAQSVIAGKDVNVTAHVNKLLENGEKALDIINNGLIAGMNVVGVKFKNGDMFVPEVLMSARAMNAGLEIVRPLIADTEVKSKGKVVLGTVKGDLHDIGKKLVAMMLESAGLEVINLGVDVAPQKFVEAVKEHKPHIVGMSALLTTTMLNMPNTIELLAEAGLRDQVKVIVGGAPVSEEFAKTIRADGFAADAGSATELCKQLIGL